MQFVCRYGAPDGRVLTEVQTGSDVDSVRRELERQGFHIFEVKPRGFSFQLRNPFAGKRKVPPQEFLAFNQELAALLRAGLPLLQALDLMLERMQNPVMNEVLTEVRDKVRSGAELSDAFEDFGDLFPPIYSSSLRAGERSGELEQVIRRFMRYLKLLLDARKRVVSALVYPSVLVGLSVLMLVVMAVYVVPNFSKFYADLDAELPAITQWTLAISFFLRDHFLAIIVAVVVSSIVFRSWFRSPSGRRAFDSFKLRVPLLGEIFHRFALSEYCRSLATLLAGGIPLVSALETATSAVGNVHVSGKLRPAIDDVREGTALHVAVERSGTFPHMAVNMLKVGEATGSLDEMLNSIGDYFDEFVETRVGRLLSLVEPVMLIIMGILIAILLISIYLPMFGALSQMSV
ncbi:MAG: type II secretion system F family protein [Thermoanaerobaculia bacterium]|nr:type II secretion system F family protein [Thermoanaerobaculia bacterium]